MESPTEYGHKRLVTKNISSSEGQLQLSSHSWVRNRVFGQRVMCEALVNR
jgi:hypothetical protein